MSKISWAIAIVLSTLGSAFFLVYLAANFEGKSYLYGWLKLLFLILALFIVLINATLPVHIIDFANQTEVTNHTFVGMANIASLNVKVVSIGITFFMWIFFVWMIIIAVKYLWRGKVEKE